MDKKQIKVLHIFENYLPDSQNWAFRLIDNLNDTENYACALEYSNSRFFKDVHLIDLPGYVTPDLITEGSYPQWTVLGKLLTKLKRKANVEKFILYIAERIKSLNIDIVHCHFAHIGWNFLNLKNKTNVPFIVSFYGFDYESLPHTFPVWEKRYKELFDIADLFICEGPFGASVLSSKGCPEEKIKINHLGVEINKIPFFKKPKKENELHLLQISNFFQKKGQIYTINAFKEALKTCPNMTLTLLGSEHEGNKSALQKIVLENNLNDKIFFHDFIDSSTLYDFMKSFQAFIHPSCYADDRDCEGGAPIVILDAQATGMPVIATTHCDLPEEVIHEKTGLLTPEKDVEALTRSIVRFYKMNEPEYTVFSQAARNHVEQNFNVKNCSDFLRNLYEEQLNALPLKENEIKNSQSFYQKVFLSGNIYAASTTSFLEIGACL